ncbi:MAG TPA: cyclopropane-fatty-acyl-phospholipid synthase family protein [Caulobacterales bacterium]|nr:cyclopropane-fatty-acyl-phospholipid synthase family protein [Caulobacterales bacterium]
MSMIASLARSYFVEGALVLRLPDGENICLGGVGPTDAPVIFHILDWRAAGAIARNPHVALGEAYMDGRLVMERGSIYDLLEIAVRNFRHHHRRTLRGAVNGAIAQLVHFNRRHAARRNVAHHYDLSYELYRRFLDADMQYSCAYFPHDGATLEEAQEAKKRLIAAKLLLSPDARVLDIGSGWGGMGLTLASEYGARVTGVTLSQEQLTIARARAAERGLEIDFRLQDYRDVEGPFDRIVSVGMLEHVGRGNYQEYFDTVARLLDKDGVALIHTIGKTDGPAIGGGWTAKYIFPGGYIPALSQLAPAIERAGLFIADVEVWRLHYALTLRAWRTRFMSRIDEIKGLYDERFCRMWEFYLAASEASFRIGPHVVFQFQLSKKIDAVPVRRDYLLGGASTALAHASDQFNRMRPASSEG